MSDERLFINYINDNYSKLKNKYKKFCIEKQYDFDEDVFSDTILKCYNAITKKGSLDDTSSQGIENYFFRSFKQNVQREKQYCRNSKRDMNVGSDNIIALYEDWYNTSKDSSINKVKNDLCIDFTVLYILDKVEQHFDAEHFKLFALKSLIPNMTYKRLQDMTHSASVRQKVVTVKQWVKANVTKDDIKKAFYEKYDELLDV